jgi:hypothetical protein
MMVSSDCCLFLRAVEASDAPKLFAGFPKGITMPVSEPTVLWTQE